MKTFEHGGQIEKFAFDLGCKVSEIIDLSSNINFVKPQINVDFNTLDISSYPTYDKLYEKIALIMELKLLKLSFSMVEVVLFLLCLNILL